MIYLLAFLMLFGCTRQSPEVKHESKPEVKATEEKAPEGKVGQIYRERYPLKNAREKLVDTKGQGPAHLAGTRNFRAVLNGVYYRGGANNKFRAQDARHNSNPLPPEGLESLCKEGFGEAVYLYSTNFETAQKEVKCKTFTGKENTLRYHQVSPLRAKKGDLETLVRMIHRHVRDPKLGPVYDHCWNGWHASGLVAATALRQFCGFSGEQAESYWILNANEGGSDHPKIKKQIREFQPIAELALTAEEKKFLCPDPKTLEFGSR